MAVRVPPLDWWVWQSEHNVMGPRWEITDLADSQDEPF